MGQPLVVVDFGFGLVVLTQHSFVDQLFITQAVYTADLEVRTR